jgi:hypothetical protein
MRGLTGLLALRGEGAAATTATGAAFPSPLVLGAGVAACAIGALVLRVALTPADPAPGAPVGPLADATFGAGSADLDAEPARNARSAVASATDTGGEIPAAFVPADEPTRLLEQSRQIKKLILDRRLAVTPEERAQAGIPTDTATSGVVRLLDRSAFGQEFTLPWMRGGGSYYSFTERVHDYNRRPQIGMDHSALQASFYGGSSSILVELGQRRLADVPATRVAPAWLDPAQRFLWQVAHTEIQPGVSLSTVYAERRNEVQEHDEVDAATQMALSQQSP